MKNVNIVLVLFFLTMSSVFAGDDWGKTGHRVTGEIAQNYLSCKAKRKLKKLLDGQSLAFASIYGDEIKSERKYDKYGPWHYVNFPFDGRYESHPKSEKGDLIVGIQYCVDVLKNKNSSRDDKIFYLKMLVHLIGDLHQPLHVGMADDRGGNDFQVRWFGEGTNLHVVWDSKMIEYENMSYTEWEANAKKLSKKEVKKIKKGTTIDWMYESRAICLEIYNRSEIGDKLRYRYPYDYLDTVRGQLQKSGIRLAAVLNDIFK